jgi:dGTPase
MDWKMLLCKDRPRVSTSTGDHREQFERDFDRTIFSTPVKRLQDKAQVFPLEPHDAIRTRLTHSLEVSSVARGLAIAVGKWLLDGKLIEPGMERSIEAISATCGLIHDLGNPPFGHSGEDAIRHWFRERFKPEDLSDHLGGKDQLIQDFLQFEGNAQSLRLLTKLQILVDFNGLNLTFGTLSASCKYTVPSHESGDNGNHAKSKPGYFASENAIVQQIREKAGTGDARNPLTYLVEAADDIVFSVADIEDAVKKGVLAWSTVEDDLKKIGHPTVVDSLNGMRRILKAGSNKEPEDLPGDIYASAFRTSTIGIVVRSVVKEFQKQYGEIMAGRYTRELFKECEAAPLVEKLKELGRTRVYCTPSNLKLELMGRRVICDLMDIFWEGAQVLPADGSLPKTTKFPGKVCALLSENYRRVFCHSVKTMRELPEQYHRFQLVTDYVCGMTDTFAKRLHAELMNG